MVKETYIEGLDYLQCQTHNDHLYHQASMEGRHCEAVPHKT